MAEPQTERGYTKINNNILDSLALNRLSGQELQIVFVVLRKTYGFNKKEDAISLTQFQDFTGIKRPKINNLLKALLLKKVLGVTKKGNGTVNLYTFQEDASLWQVLPKKVLGVTKKGNEVLPKKVIRVLPNLGHTKERFTKDIITKDIPASFNDFYNAYPKKKSKDAAKRAWEKIKPNTILLKNMLANIEIMKQTEDWKKENGSFIPYPATWLNGKRWEDEIYDPSIPQPPTGLIDVGDATTYMLQNIPGFHADMENWIDLWVDAGNTQSEVLGKKSYADWLKFVSDFKETHNA